MVIYGYIVIYDQTDRPKMMREDDRKTLRKMRIFHAKRK